MSLFDWISQGPAPEGTSPPAAPSVRERCSSQIFLPNPTSATGFISETEFSLACIRLGCQVFRPIVEGGEIDLIVMTPTGRFWRVQVKTAHSAGKHGGVQFTVLRGNWRDGKRPYQGIDVFVGVQGREFWIVPQSEAKGRTKIRCGPQSPYRNAWDVLGLEAL